MHEGVDAMGRGRQKAKQTKVARELKYFSPATDYDALQRELGTGQPDGYPSFPPALDESPADEDDETDDDEDDDYKGWSTGSGR